jgi:hypothetical protein
MLRELTYMEVCCEQCPLDCCYAADGTFQKISAAVRENDYAVFVAYVRILIEKVRGWKV